MKLTKTLFVVFCLLGLAAAVQAQPFQAFLFNDSVPLLASTATGCNGAPLAEGTLIWIYWDNDSNGPDMDDPLADVGSNEGQVNFDNFPINGISAELGPGLFATELDFFSIGGMPDPARYYLVVRCTNDSSLWVWNSAVITMTVGPQEHNITDWTCAGAVCADCPPPPQVGNLAASDDQCNGILVSWTYPNDVPNLDEFRIYREGSLIATLTNIALRSYLDTDITGSSILYQVVAHTSCGALSLPAIEFGTRLLGPPTATGVTASDATCNQVLVNWTYSTNAGLDRWVITRNGVAIDSIANTGQVPGPRSYTHNNAPGGAALYCVYGSSNACGWGTAACDSGQAVATPAQVQNVQASDGNCTTTIVTWTDVAGESGYNVWRANQDGSGGTQIASNLPANTTSYNDNTGVVGTIYRYWIVATNTCGSSPVSAFDLGHRLAIPGQPTGFVASDGTDCNAVVLNWANVSGEAGYYVYRNAAVIDSVTADVLTYSDATAVPGTVYSYQVSAYNTCGISQLSVANDGFRGTVPAQVTNVQASDARCDSIVVTWTAVAGATTYRIRQNGTEVGTATGTRFAHAPAVGTYAYTVAGESVCGAGEQSAPDSGTRLDGVVLPQIPGVSASDNNCSAVVITWANVAGEDSFQVRRNGARIGGVAADVLTFSDLTAVPFTNYTYRVVGYNACGMGDTTGSDQGMMPVAPVQVAGVAATDDRCDGVVVTWQNVAGEDSFQVQRNGTRVGAVLANVLTYTDATAMPGTDYQYTVSAYNTCGAGPVSAADGGLRREAPQTPAWVIASDTICGSITVNWGAALGSVDSYLIYRNATLIRTVPADTTDYLIIDAPGAATYGYSVRAHSNFPTCPDSPPAADSGRARFAPSAPATLTAGPAVCDQVNLNWNASTGEVVGYIVYRDGAIIDTSVNTTYADVSVNDMASHNYVVRGYNAYCGQGDPSNQVAGRLRELLLAPALPNDTLAGGSMITVDLNHCEGVESDSVFVSVNDGAYEFVVALSPVQPTVNLEIPTVPGTVANNRFKFVSTRGARRDSVVTAPFVIQALSVDPFAEVPTDFFLNQNYPNPFNPSTTVRFGVPQTTMVTVEIYDLMGRRVTTLVNDVLQPGVHNVVWDCATCPSGTYLLRMQTGQTTMLRKMLLMK